MIFLYSAVVMVVGCEGAAQCRRMGEKRERWGKIRKERTLDEVQGCRG